MKNQTRYRPAAMLLMLGILILSGCTGTRVVLEHDPGRTDRDERKYEQRQHRGGPPPWAPAHGHRAKKYRYYPSVQVYYDTHRDIYFYYRNGRWEVSASLPGPIRMEIGDHITLEMDTDRPYKYHSEVVEHYPPGLNKNKGRGNNKDKIKQKDKW
ncbi:MAG: hypothetical protein K9J79_01190 [Desulfobacteraceae bacterium]|nr:hypothetical protein [Desulfobacteraceae bacterium]MCF8093954.1 hypothetical protein [Desulfobacteraceae bacterium]